MIWSLAILILATCLSALEAAQPATERYRSTRQFRQWQRRKGVMGQGPPMGW